MKKTTLSRRLSAVASFVSPCDCLADIGTDHAYLPIYLCEENVTARCIAMDVRSGPLARAEANIQEAGLSERIGTRLSDGLEKLAPGEADACTIAGMGGLLICRILEAGKETAENLKEIILEPQSETERVRAFVTGNGWIIDREAMILESGKFYPVMHCRRPEQGEGVQKLSTEELAFGPVLLREKDPTLQAYLAARKNTCLAILETLSEGTGVRTKERRSEVKEELRMIASALEEYEK